MEHVWDAGDKGCGLLVIELARRVRDLPSGDALRVVAADASAVADITAWCRMTGHRFHDASPLPVVVVEPSGPRSPR
ncbi:MAG: sulfurtransferase TusA family protein [Planctomycetes bacterium]|nr:sulfurtransferase TusA family protein [Planctomycetota bacterium]MCB9828149.1 sulfurtransferase TusA family protein [Planctomycetota bacterium]MCB9901503.1 sulfurtransferase TusA family protein [Planctomycetota bacterium]